jgi:glyoxylase-like metal-dependent hydrolase (beta-lactamase superfamily II)
VDALRALRDRTGAPVYASEIDAPIIEDPTIFPSYGGRAQPCPVDVKLRDKATVKIGSMKWKAILTPGHTPGGMCFQLQSEYGNHPEGWDVLVSGDTLFCGSIGRTDFPGGNMGQMQTSLRKLSQLPPRTVVLPGHNALTTIADEKNRVFRYYC